MANFSNNDVNIGDIFYFCSGQDELHNPKYIYFEIIGKVDKTCVLLKELNVNKKSNNQIEIIKGQYKNNKKIRKRLSVSEYSGEIYIKMNFNGTDTYGYLYK